MQQIVESGKALYIGISNYNCEQTKAAVACYRALRVPFVLTQMPYSILERTIETGGIKAFAHEQGFAVTAYSPLAQGLLTDKYLHGIPEGSRMSKDMFLKQSVLTPELQKKLLALNEVAARRGQTLAEMALSWVLKDEDVASVIIGASRSSQIEDDIRVNAQFTAEELAEIDSIVL